MNHALTFRMEGRSVFAPAHLPPAIEALESRRLFSHVIVRTDFDVLDGDIGARGNGLGLPPPALGLPGPVLDLPHPRNVLSGGRRTRGAFDLRGLYTGTVDVDDLGSARIDVEVTRQRRGRISGSVSSPLLDDDISGTVPVMFHRNRRFTIRLADDDAFVQVSGRANRDGTVTGAIHGSAGGERFHGTFSLHRIGGPGWRLHRLD